MIKRQFLNDYLNDYLNCAEYQDYAPNGLQVEGRDDIYKICSAVTASCQVIDAAIQQKADALLVHHGYFWRGENPVIVGNKKLRISKLLTNSLNLYAYHLPLDCHPVIGNNACLGNLLPVHSCERHPAHNTPSLLWTGRLHQPITASALSTIITDVLQRQPLHICGEENQLINKIAWCSGGAQDLIEDAYKLGADAFISGEVSERTYYLAQELPIHYFGCGHHATERYGIQALGAHLAEKFQLEHVYIEVDNPV